MNGVVLSYLELFHGGGNLDRGLRSEGLAHERYFEFGPQYESDAEDQ